MNQPRTADGAAVLSAVEAALSGNGFGPVVDVAGALALAQAQGVPGAVAAGLIGAAAQGVRLGVLDRDEAEKEGKDERQP